MNFRIWDRDIALNGMRESLLVTIGCRIHGGCCMLWVLMNVFLRDWKDWSWRNKNLSESNTFFLGWSSVNVRFVQMIKPLFPFVRDWTLIDKILITLSMLCVIRGLYFMPIFGINRANLPSHLNLSSPGHPCQISVCPFMGCCLEQRMLEKIFMAEDSVPLNIAMLGIGPIIASSYVIQLMLNVPVFGYLPGPTRALLNKKRMGSLTNVLQLYFSFFSFDWHLVEL